MRDEAAVRADAMALECGRLRRRRRHRQHRAAGGLFESAAQLEFFLGAARLPVPGRDRQSEERSRSNAGRKSGSEAPLSDSHCANHDARGIGVHSKQVVPVRLVLKIAVILIFIAILASLGSALFFLVTDRGQSKRTVKALALRVGLSLTLFLLLMAGYYFGLIPGKIG